MRSYRIVQILPDGWKKAFKVEGFYDIPSRELQQEPPYKPVSYYGGWLTAQYKGFPAIVDTLREAEGLVEYLQRIDKAIQAQKDFTPIVIKTY